MNAKQHEILLEKYTALGGDARIINAVKNFSLKNYAKLKYEYSKIENKTTAPPPETPPKEATPPPQKIGFKDFISDYPAQLHPTYRKRLEVWLSLCSLKIQFNEIPPRQEEKAFALQYQIYLLFKEMDRLEHILKHYRQYKRIMPTETKKDFSEKTELELYKQRNNLRSLITRREQTIAKMQAEIFSDREPTPKQLHLLNLKKEQLQQKINELIEIEKRLVQG